MPLSFFFFFNDTATTEIYTLSLHDALPISAGAPIAAAWDTSSAPGLRTLSGSGISTSPISQPSTTQMTSRDRKSTRLNSSHQIISYAVFCLKKKKKATIDTQHMLLDATALL